MEPYVTKDYISALEQVLSRRYDRNEFCLDGYQECSVCLQYDNGKWVVFDAERGNRYDEVFCITVLEACLNVIRKMTHQAEDISSMERELIVLLKSETGDTLKSA